MKIHPHHGVSQNLRDLAAWIIAPTSVLQKRFALFIRRRLRATLLALIAVLLLLGITTILTVYSPTNNINLLILHGILVVAGILLVTLAMILIQRDLLAPLSDLREWAYLMRNGDLSARLSIPVRDEFITLAQDINTLGEAIQSLSRDMENQVHKQTRRIKDKSRSLQILYDVAASINTSRDQDDLLTRFLYTLKDVTHARAASVRMLGSDGQMNLVASIGLNNDLLEKECSPSLQKDLFEIDSNHKKNKDIIPSDTTVSLFDNKTVKMLTVPLQYRGRTLGTYNLYVERKNLDNSEDMIELLTSIGRHLGMAIEKAQLDKEANQMSVMAERTRIAHELHDSLAQTLASLRFQVRVLDETLHRGDEAALWQALEVIEAGMEEAHTELRGLINHFCAPIDRRGLIPAIEQLSERFRNDTGSQLFFQNEWDQLPFNDEQEIEILRIIQESLANIRKHSQANTTRIMLSYKSNEYRVLIEDDGIGISHEQPVSGIPGEHVGLGIMEERAKRLGGSLKIESEPGEGTQILLNFRIKPDLASESEIKDYML
ncbi:MAG: histidine kinase [Gammaproteobacteria bacterium]|nr:histidine kinase [Gammaproteobacteria bacterium]